MERCPECQGDLIMVEYSLMDKYHYDGVSEHFCKHCGLRWGRWCGQKLGPEEVEKPNCDGTGHPRIITLEQGGDNV